MGRTSESAEETWKRTQPDCRKSSPRRRGLHDSATYFSGQHWPSDLLCHRRLTCATMNASKRLAFNNFSKNLALCCDLQKIEIRLLARSVFSEHTFNGKIAPSTATVKTSDIASGRGQAVGANTRPLHRLTDCEHREMLYALHCL